jgi:hypothetical protein
MNHSGLSIPEITYEILLNLDYKSILWFCCTNKEYFGISQDDWFWKRKVEKDFKPTINYLPTNVSHRKIYINLINTDQHIESHISNGDLYILVWLKHSKNYNFNDLTLFELATRREHLHILDWLCEIEPDNIFTDSILETAFDYGKHEVLKWLKDRGVRISEIYVHTALRRGDLWILKWLKEQGVTFNRGQVSISLFYCYFHIADWLYEQGLVPDDTFFDIFTQYNNIPILEWLKTRGIMPPREFAVSQAITDGHLEGLKWLYDNGYPIEERHLNNTWNPHIIAWLNENDII